MSTQRIAFTTKCINHPNRASLRGDLPLSSIVFSQSMCIVCTIRPGLSGSAGSLILASNTLIRPAQAKPCLRLAFLDKTRDYSVASTNRQSLKTDPTSCYYFPVNLSTLELKSYHLAASPPA